MTTNNLFANALKNEASWTLTENGAVAKNTTGNACLDIFGTIGALRNADDDRLFRLFEEAYKEDPLTATKILFYARDIREGCGERDVFRKLVNYAADKHPEAVVKNVALFGYYGRFDDMYCLIGTKLEDTMWTAMKEQFSSDVYNMEHDGVVSLLAKWIKTPDASSKNTREVGILTAKKLGYSVYTFKRLLRKLRKYIDVTEVKMSANNWGEISYSAVPSRAMTLYRNAFAKHDGDRFNEFVNKAVTGEEKINSSTLYPYDLIEKVLNSVSFYGLLSGAKLKEDDVIEAQWRQLPNYVEPGTNAIVMADTSGSMNGRPLYSALGLAIYFAERNVGAFHNLFMSFSEQPNIHEIKGNTLAQKIVSIDMRDWDMNTNLHAAFIKVLDLAIRNNVPAEEMVKSIIVISDMEIDECGDRRWTFYDHVAAEYAEAGYQIPNVIFWNVNSRNDVFHADSNRKGVQLVSGQSTTTFKQLVDSIGLTPIEMMHKVIDSERYSLIKL